mgnify:CR=1 FL=1
MDNISRYSIIRSMSMTFDYKKYYNKEIGVLKEKSEKKVDIKYLIKELHSDLSEAMLQG